MRDKPRLLLAIAGVAFAVVLVSVQLGFRAAMYDGAVRCYRAFRFDLAMLSPKTPFIGFPEQFSRRRLYQVLGARGVAAVTPVYLAQGFWRNPWDFSVRNIFVLGFDPSHDVLDVPGFPATDCSGPASTSSWSGSARACSTWFRSRWRSSSPSCTGTSAGRCRRCW